jgi:hypothetical protein
MRRTRDRLLVEEFLGEIRASAAAEAPAVDDPPDG